MLASTAEAAAATDDDDVEGEDDADDEFTEDAEDEDDDDDDPHRWLLEEDSQAPNLVPEKNPRNVLAGRIEIAELIGQGGMGAVWRSSGPLRSRCSTRCSNSARTAASAAPIDVDAVET